MHSFRIAIVAIAALLLAASSARAEDRPINYPAEIPQSTQANLTPRDARITRGLLFRDLLGNVATAGVYADLSIVPNGGMYLAVQPTIAGTIGTLYQLGPDDANPLPLNFSPQLPADPTLIVLTGQQSAPVGGIGPLVAPNSGNEQYYLVEGKVVSLDDTPVSTAFEDSYGNRTFQTVPTLRHDHILYQVKSGAASTSPIVPTVDSGYVGIGYVLVTGGETAITQSTITALPPFGGFVANGEPLTASSLTIPNIADGCLNIAGGAVSSLPCTSGIGSVTGNYPLSSTTNSGTVTLTCPTCVTSVSASSGLVSSGGTAPTISLQSGTLGSTGYAIGSALYGPSQSTVADSYANAYHLKSNSVSALQDDGTNSGWNFDCGASATYCFRFWIGAPGTTTQLLQIGPTNVSASAPLLGTTATFSGQVTASLFASGSSSYGPTSASVNGPVSASGQISSSANANGAVPTTCCAVVTNNYSAGSSEVNIFNTVKAAASQTQPAIDFHTLDQNGNNLTLGTLYRDGDFSAVGSLYFGQNTFGTATPIYAGQGRQGALNWNHSGGAGEVNFYDLYNINNGSIVAFDWRAIISNTDTQLMRLDRGGNLYASAYYSVSRRAFKRDIRPLDVDALDVVRRTKIVRYAYKTDPRGTDLRTGFIADDTPSILAGSKHNHYDVNAVAAVDLAAIQQLDKRLSADEAKRDRAKTDGRDPLMMFLMGLSSGGAILAILCALTMLKKRV